MRPDEVSEPTGGRILFATSFLPILGGLALLGMRNGAGSSGDVRIACLLVAGLGWLLACRLARNGRGNLPLVLGGAVLLRVVVGVVGPSFSDDAYRYLWEGESVLEGRSPYASSPQDAQSGDAVAADLQRRFPELWSRVGHKDVRAAYPPLAQFVGAATAAACRALRAPPETTGISMLRAFYGLCDLAVIGCLVGMLHRAGRPRALAVVWAWCPLPAIEFAGSAHLDSLGILLLLAALSSSAVPAAGGIRSLSGLAAGILTKYVPAASLPWIVSSGNARRRAVVQRTGLVVLLVALGFVPFLFLRGGSRGLFGGLGEYAFRWDSSSLLHRFVEGFFARFADRDESWSDPRRLSRAVEALAWLGIAIACVRGERDAIRGTAVLLGAWLLLSPTLHPWYLCWMLPFLALRPSRAWTWLVFAAPLLYVPLESWKRDGVWTEPAWLWPTVALPFLVLFAWENLGGNRASVPGRLGA